MIRQASVSRLRLSSDPLHRGSGHRNTISQGTDGHNWELILYGDTMREALRRVHRKLVGQPAPGQILMNLLQRRRRMFW